MSNVWRISRSHCLCLLNITPGFNRLSFANLVFYQNIWHKKTRSIRSGLFVIFAEVEGFEPPVPCGTSVFKTGAFDHSATPPLNNAAKVHTSFQIQS